ncbi:MAG: Mov34/MPN/PAD-1 family protein, partial [archaeon]
MWKVKRTLLLDAGMAARNYYPKEFMCFLGGNGENETIEEIVFLPTQTSENSASVNELDIPFDDTIIGSFHSHPSGPNSPSRQDKKFFLKYKINAIINNPFTP